MIVPKYLKERKPSCSSTFLFFLVKCQTKLLKELAAHCSSKGKDHGKMPVYCHADVTKIRCLSSTDCKLFAHAFSFMQLHELCSVESVTLD